MMDAGFVILILSFFVIALVYSSVGFGGGTSYLALMAVMNVHYEIMRPTALLCNIVVVTGGTWIFYKEGKLDLKKCLPFIAASIPMAFIGGYWKLTASLFFIILGFSLLLTSILLWIKPSDNIKSRSSNFITNAGLGSGIGFLSGLVSIGGGIFLSPALHLMNWDEAKKISALASLFILVNSVSGLAGQFTRAAAIDWGFALPLLAAVLTGGQLGSRLGAKRFNPTYIKRITAVLTLAAALNILKDYL